MKTVEKKLKRFIQIYKEIKTVKKERQRIFKVFEKKTGLYLSTASKGNVNKSNFRNTKEKASLPPLK